MKTRFGMTLALSLGYLLVAAACLTRWGSPHPWSRLDDFAGGYLILRFLSSIYSVISSREVFRSVPVKQQWWALDSDSEGPKWVMFLMGLDLLVFLDYGHRRLSPWLAHPALQMAGLALYLAVSLWQIWTDAHLARYFRQQTPVAPMNYGPYRYLRHPRYVAAIVGKIAMALSLASILGWFLVIAWAVLLLKKVAVEEKHLRKLFGVRYESYARTTAKIIPGIY